MTSPTAASEVGSSVGVEPATLPILEYLHHHHSSDIHHHQHQHHQQQQYYHHESAHSNSMSPSSLVHLAQTDPLSLSYVATTSTGKTIESSSVHFHLCMACNTL